MNDQSKHQEMQLVEESSLDQVTGGTLPWNHPFDSPKERPAVQNIISADPNVHPKHIAQELVHQNETAVILPHVASEVAKIHLNSDGTRTIAFKPGRLYPDGKVLHNQY
jgi:hypothetical protein